jgi:hypothetical protein
VYNLFKFIEDKRPEYKVPFKFKLLYKPESITKEDLKVKGSLNLSNTSVQSLPNGLEVKGNLDLIGASQIKSLPDDLKVGGYLDLVGAPIQYLPNNLKVGGYLVLYGTPLSKKYTTVEQLKAEYPDLKVKGKIYL